MSNLRLQFLPNYKVSDYEQWEGDWELIDGIPYAMSPSANRRHQRVAANLVFSFKQQLDKCHCEVLYELDWRLDDFTVMRPDIVITCNDENADFIYTPPKLIVEILSTSTKHKDRFLKYGKYEKAGVKWYILANPDTKEMTVFQLVNNTYKKHEELNLSIDKNCYIMLDNEDIWE